jgi:hypothetical protein
MDLNQTLEIFQAVVANREVTLWSALPCQRFGNRKVGLGQQIPKR